MAMSKQEDENYWTSSVKKGFDFDSEEKQDHFSELFGVTRQETARLSKQVQGININQHKETTQLSKRAQNVNTSPTTCHPAQPKAPSSISSLNSNSSSTELSSSIRTKKQNENCLVTNKLLSTTIHVESVLSPKDVIRSLFLGMPVDLNHFKKLIDKTSLLDEAIKLGDGDVVVAVLLYLQKTLHQSVLFSVLESRQVAADQYIDMLEKQNCYKEAATLCSQMKRNREAAVHLYNKVLREKKKDLLPSLQHLCKYEFQILSGVETETEILKEHIQLLERQAPIASHQVPAKELVSDKTSPLIGPPIRQDSLLGSSLLATLQYCCRYHLKSPENLLVSPVGLKSTFPITDRQFAWNACVGQLLSGKDPSPSLLAKGLFGAPKVVAGLSVPRVLEVAWKMEGPPQTFDQLLPLIESSQLRYQLAKRYNRHRIVIDV